MEPINSNSSSNQTSNTNSDSINNLDNLVSTLANSATTAANAASPTTTATTLTATSSVSQSLLDSFYQGISLMQNVSPSAISSYLQQVSQQQKNLGTPLSLVQQQSLLQYSMSQLSQQGESSSALYQATNQTLMGTFMMSMMLTDYLHKIFRNISDNQNSSSDWV